MLDQERPDHGSGRSCQPVDPGLEGQGCQSFDGLRTGLRPLVDEAAGLTQAFGRCDPSASLRTGLAKVPRDDVPSAGPGARPLARSLIPV
jgi:hypothetical protein